MLTTSALGRRYAVANSLVAGRTRPEHSEEAHESRSAKTSMAPVFVSCSSARSYSLLRSLDPRYMNRFHAVGA
jgi:hypothetical protein